MHSCSCGQYSAYRQRGKEVFPQLFARAVDDDAGGAEIVAEDVATTIILRVVAAIEGDELVAGVVVLGAGREGDAAEVDVAVGVVFWRVAADEIVG